MQMLTCITHRYGQQRRHGYRTGYPGQVQGSLLMYFSIWPLSSALNNSAIPSAPAIP